MLKLKSKLGDDLDLYISHNESCVDDQRTLHKAHDHTLQKRKQGSSSRRKVRLKNGKQQFISA